LLTSCPLLLRNLRLDLRERGARFPQIPDALIQRIPRAITRLDLELTPVSSDPLVVLVDPSSGTMALAFGRSLLKVTVPPSHGHRESLLGGPRSIDRLCAAPL